MPLWGMLLLALSQTLAQAPRFATSVRTVEVYASIDTADGTPIVDLRAGEFHIFEDGQPQRVDVFAAGEFPLAVALAVDRSFSMSGERLAMARSAAHVFLGDLRPEDQAMIVAVGSQVEIVAPLSNDRVTQHQAVTGLKPWGTTPLHDAIIASVDRIQPAGGRRALVLLTDGDDRYSVATAEMVLDHVRRSDVLVYPVVIGSRVSTLLDRVAALTGGRVSYVAKPGSLAPALHAVALDLRHQYLLGYSPSRPAEQTPAWRTIEVRVDRPNARVRARQGYWTDQPRF